MDPRNTSETTPKLLLAELQCWQFESMGCVTIMIKSGLTYSITDLSSNLEALIARALLIKGKTFNTLNTNDGHAPSLV